MPAGPIRLTTLTSSSRRRSSAIVCCTLRASTPKTGLRGPVTGMRCEVSASRRASPVCEESVESASTTNWFARIVVVACAVPSGATLGNDSSRDSGS